MYVVGLINCTYKENPKTIHLKVSKKIFFDSFTLQLILANSIVILMNASLLNIPIMIEVETSMIEKASLDQCFYGKHCFYMDVKEAIGCYSNYL